MRAFAPTTLLLFIALQPAAPLAPLALVGAIDLPSVEGRIDHLAIDPTGAGHRLFVGCRQPPNVLVYDTTNGKPIGAFEIVGDTDDLFFDPPRRRLYVAGGEGFIDVLDARSPATLTRLARIPTAAGARTALFAPDRGRLYLAVPHRGAQKAEIRVCEARD